MKLKRFEVRTSARFSKAVVSGKIILYGWAACDTVDGEAYVDSEGDHIPGDVLYEAACEYAKYSRVVLYEHSGEPIGHALHTMPLVADLANDLGIQSPKTGLLVGSEVDEMAGELYDKGLIAGYSINGVMRYTGEEGARVATFVWMDELSVCSQPIASAATILAGRSEEEARISKSAWNQLAKFPRGRYGMPESGQSTKTLDRGESIPDHPHEQVGETPMTEAERKELEAHKKAAEDAKAEVAIAKSEAAALQKRIDEAEAKSKEDDEKTADVKKAADTPTPKVVYTAIGGDIYTDADDARLVKLAKDSDEKEIEIRKAKVPGADADVVETLVRSGNEKAWDAFVKQNEAIAKLQKARTKHPRDADYTTLEDKTPSDGTVQKTEERTSEISKAHNLPTGLAGIYAVGEEQFAKQEEAA